MTKRIENILVIGAYAFGICLNVIAMDTACRLDFPLWIDNCMEIGLTKMAIYALITFGIPTYHFGGKGGLKMGIVFSCLFVLFLLGTWLAYETIAGAWLSIIGFIVAIPLVALYVTAYREEWQKKKRSVSESSLEKPS